MNKYLITGGSGFIGTNLLEHHLKKGDAVLNLDVNEPRNKDHLQYYKCVDLLSGNALISLVNDFKPDFVYHLGARTDLDGKDESDYLANTQGLTNIISACDSANTVKRVVFASSRLVCEIGYKPKNYDDYCPTTAYGKSKVDGEIIVKSLPAKKWSWVIVRPTSIWGPWFATPYRNFFDAVARNIYFHPGDECILKSFGYVGNSVFQLYQLMHAKDSQVDGKTFFLGDYQPIDVLDFANVISESFSAKKPKSLPLFLLQFLAGLGDILERFGRRAPLTSFRLSNLRTPMIYDFDDLASVVGTLPFNSKQGISETVRWMKKN